MDVRRRLLQEPDELETHQQVLGKVAQLVEGCCERFDAIAAKPGGAGAFARLARQAVWDLRAEMHEVFRMPQLLAGADLSQNHRILRQSLQEASRRAEALHCDMAGQLEANEEASRRAEALHCDMAGQLEANEELAAQLKHEVEFRRQETTTWTQRHTIVNLRRDDLQAQSEREITCLSSQLRSLEQAPLRAAGGVRAALPGGVRGGPRRVPSHMQAETRGGEGCPRGGRLR